MAIEVKIENNNIDAIFKAVEEARERALIKIGQRAEKYAKALCPVGTPESTGKKGYRGSTLRNSITYDVQNEGHSSIVQVGTNVEYAPYVELGTGPYFVAPPEWEEFTTEIGSGVGKGYVHPRPFLQPAITDHVDEYKQIFEDQLKS